MSAREGRCLFVVDFKFFDISVEAVGEKLRDIIKEKKRGFSFSIRFRD